MLQLAFQFERKRETQVYFRNRLGILLRIDSE